MVVTYIYNRETINFDSEISDRGSYLTLATVYVAPRRTVSGSRSRKLRHQRTSGCEPRTREAFRDPSRFLCQPTERWLLNLSVGVRAIGQSDLFIRVISRFQNFTHYFILTCLLLTFLHAKYPILCDTPMAEYIVPEVD